MRKMKYDYGYVIDSNALEAVSEPLVSSANSIIRYPCTAGHKKSIEACLDY